MGEKLVVGKVIKMPAMRRGLCGYRDETVLVSNDTLKAMAETIHGIPVVIDHQLVDSGNVDKLVVGRVADMHYEPETDNWDVHFVVDDQAAVDKLATGWGVSTAYRITQAGPGGTLNNVPYQREVLAATYDHLAIVESPRYEMARNPVFYNSVDEKALNTGADSSNINDSIPKKGTSMIGKLWRKVCEEFKVNSNEELFVNVGDKEVALNDVLTAVHAHEVKMNSKKIVMNGDDMVEYNGEKLTVNALVAKYNEAKATEEKGEEKAEEKEENAEGEEKKENAEGEEKKENAEGEEKKENAEEKKEEDTKVNSNFADLKAVHASAIVPQASTELTMKDKLALGMKLFG